MVAIPITVYLVVEGGGVFSATYDTIQGAHFIL